MRPVELAWGGASFSALLTGGRACLGLAIYLDVWKKNEAARGQQQQAVGGKAGRQAGRQARQGGEARRARCGWLGRDAICTSEAALTAGCSDTVRESGKRLRNDWIRND